MEYLHWVKTVKQVIMQYEFNTNHKENMSEAQETHTTLKTAFITNEK